MSEKRMISWVAILCLGLGLAVPVAGRAQDAPPPAIAEESAEMASLEPFVLERATTAEPVAHRSTGQKIAEKLREKGLSEDATIVLISMLPIVELRGAIPVGHLLLPDANSETRLGRDDLLRAGRIYVWAVLGNMIPVPFILWLLGPISRLCMNISIGKRFFEWLFARTRRKTAGIEKYEFFGLTVFVAIPLPVTGAWTGAMAGWLLGLRTGTAFLSILFGVMIAGVIMTVLSLMGWLGAAVAGVVLLGFFGGFLLKARK